MPSQEPTHPGTEQRVREILTRANSQLAALRGHVFDVLTISKPVSAEAAVNLAKVLSKLSPIVGNLIEFNIVELLNDDEKLAAWGQWHRQDPGFPDAIFRGALTPEPGIEIKAWFPLATEITARFRDSQVVFAEDNIDVALIAWLPEHLVYGKPRIVSVAVASGLSVARARDDHYYNPPDYLVLEPEDTSQRTANLQQTNTEGYKWQGSDEELERAQALVSGWGAGGFTYEPTPEHRMRIRELTATYNYRRDTNFAKVDRIAHPEIEEFKRSVLSLEVHGLTVRQWARLFAGRDTSLLQTALEERLQIREEDADRLIQ